MSYEVVIMAKIKGKQDGENGRNEHYDIGKRKGVKRSVVVKEVLAGKHPDSHVVKIKGRKYVRDNPDTTKSDNVNPK
jgi:hypothetical protein